MAISHISEWAEKLPELKRHIAIDKLKSGELSWQEYTSSLTSEELEEEKELSRERARKHYNNNRDTINCRRREKVTCECCGSTFARGGRHTHVRTKKHQDAMKIQNIQN